VVTTLFDAIHGDLAGWHGLEPSQTVADISFGLGGVTLIRDAAPAIRGSSRYLVSVLERAEPPREVEAWVAVGSDRVAFVEVDVPDLADLEGTLERLGRPDLVLSDRRFEADATVRDHVYARRGLTVSVAEPFTPSPTAPRRAVRLGMFAPTSPETYLTEIDRGSELSPATHPQPEGDRR
jgi:hypothetical protein